MARAFIRTFGVIVLVVVAVACSFWAGLLATLWGPAANEPFPLDGGRYGNEVKQLPHHQGRSISYLRANAAPYISSSPPPFFISAYVDPGQPTQDWALHVVLTLDHLDISKRELQGRLHLWAPEVVQRALYDVDAHSSLSELVSSLTASHAASTEVLTLLQRKMGYGGFVAEPLHVSLRDLYPRSDVAWSLQDSGVEHSVNFQLSGTPELFPDDWYWLATSLEPQLLPQYTLTDGVKHASQLLIDVDVGDNGVMQNADVLLNVGPTPTWWLANVNVLMKRDEASRVQAWTFAVLPCALGLPLLFLLMRRPPWDNSVIGLIVAGSAAFLTVPALRSAIVPSAIQSVTRIDVLLWGECLVLIALGAAWLIVSPGTAPAKRADETPDVSGGRVVPLTRPHSMDSIGWRSLLAAGAWGFILALAILKIRRRLGAF